MKVRGRLTASGLMAHKHFLQTPRILRALQRSTPRWKVNREEHAEVPAVSCKSPLTWAACRNLNMVPRLRAQPGLTGPWSVERPLRLLTAARSGLVDGAYALSLCWWDITPSQRYYYLFRRWNIRIGSWFAPRTCHVVLKMLQRYTHLRAEVLARKLRDRGNILYDIR